MESLGMSGFWQNKRVFVTGHTGFKGSWLSLWLHHLGAQVRGFSLEPPTTPNLFAVADIEPLIEHQVADIRDYAAISQAMTAYKPDIVLHLAAQPLLRFSYETPVETYATNVMGTVHVLEAVRHCESVRATLVVTSDKCYENKGVAHPPYQEQDPMGGYDPYSSSKGCAELVVAAYGRSYFQHTGQALGSARAGNVIGGGDWARDRLMTDIVTAFINGTSPQLRMPQAIRPWQHVLEPLAGYLRAAEYLWETKPPLPEAWNFGPGKAAEVSVAEVTTLAAKTWGAEAEHRVTPAVAPLHEAAHLTLDAGKAKRQLGWRPQLSLSEAVEMTTVWFKHWQEHAMMQEITLEQIKAYEHRLS